MNIYRIYVSPTSDLTSPIFENKNNGIQVSSISMNHYESWL